VSAFPAGSSHAGGRLTWLGHSTVLVELDGMRLVTELPVWGWGRTVGRGHLDPLGASAAVRLLRPRVVVPIHWGTYRIAGARRPDASPAERFRATALDVEVRILAPGESLALFPR
jgi:L-ascorbate metabolism protein UlaG (beta-lactamase superfamily)